MGRVRRSATFTILMVCTGFLLTACVTTVDRNIAKFERGTDGLNVLLMPVDIELSEVNAGGLKEPKADWTAAAKKNINTGIDKVLSQRKAQVIRYQEPADDTSAAGDQLQLIKLHGVVGSTIMLHGGGGSNALARPPGFVLPTKKDRFDWTLGPDVRALRGNSKADYALFTYVRDSYASGGRVAVIMVGALLFGVALPGGQQIGFASLVDLDTGKIVWFNRLGRGTGDLRNMTDAMETVETIFADLPK